jgi:deoxyribonuclease V
VPGPATALHHWDLSVAEAEALQRELVARVVEGPPLTEAAFVGGVDVGIRKVGSERERYESAKEEVARAAVVVLTYPDLRPIEQATYEAPVTFPYVPGLLAFREAPAVLAAIAKLRQPPDVFILDGQGRAHPRRFGIACHVGLWLDKPTIGCAKSRLVGRHDEPGPERGGHAPLLAGREVIGAVIRSKPRTNPLYVSVGHKIDLDSAVQFVLNCLRGYRLPEPTRLAHQAAAGQDVVASSGQPALFE